MTLNKILAFDALTCALIGALLILFAPALAAWLGLPRDLLFYAGWLLIPVALFMALLARGTPPWMGGVWLVILGNAGWVLASLAILPVTGPNLLGAGFVLVQAGVVACFTMAELGAARRFAGVAR